MVTAIMYSPRNSFVPHLSYSGFYYIRKCGLRQLGFSSFHGLFTPDLRLMLFSMQPYGYKAGALPRADDSQAAAPYIRNCNIFTSWFSNS
ncbi:hypothetical protein CBFG_02687 [Clostridiales bacterium 1_7_47FAA]|nr:hypothetical protein CBFG_02687 [Clostridiales bacterium 1_7_47FAA]